MRYYLIVVLCYFVYGTSAQDRAVDSLKNELKKKPADTAFCKILYQLAETASEEEWPGYNEQLLNFTEKYLKQESKNSEKYLFYKLYRAHALSNKSILIARKGLYMEALKYLEENIKVYTELGDDEHLAYTYNIIGTSCLGQGNVQEALVYFYKCIPIHDRKGNNYGLAIAWNNIASVSRLQKDFAQSKRLHEKSMNYYKIVGNKKGEAESLINISGIYRETGEYEKALQYVLKSLKILEEIDDQRGISIALNNVGMLYLKDGDKSAKTGKNREIALEYLFRSLSVREKINDKQLVCNSLANIGNVYFENREFDKALEYGGRSFSLARDGGWVIEMMESSRLLANCYKVMLKYRQAYDYFGIYIQMRDSIGNEENKKATIKNQLKYEYEKKAAADSVKTSEEKKVVQAQLKQEQTQRYSLYGGLALVFVFALFMVNRFRITNKQKKLIEEQKKVVEEQKQIVEEKQMEILDSIRYARRIQTALLSSDYYINKQLSKLNSNKK